MNSLPNLKYESVYEPRTDFYGENVWNLLKGGQEATPYSTNATSFSNNQFQFTIVPPSKRCILDRIVMIKVPVTITVIANNTGANKILQPGRIALRAYPINSISQSVSLELNGNKNTIDSYAIVHALSRFKRDADLMKTLYSLFPSFEDNYQTYDLADGAVNNPLATYGESISYNPRGAYKWEVISDTTNAGVSTAIFATVINELMIVPPLITNGIEQKGFTWLDTVTLTVNLTSNLDRILSVSPTLASSGGVTITSVNVTFSQPQVLLNWITPRLEIPPEVKLNMEEYYPWFQVTRYTNTAVGTTAPGGTLTNVGTNPILLNGVPLRIYLFAKRSDTDIGSSLINRITSTDTFLRIDGVSIQFNNKSGLLSNASPAHLYNMSYQNGLSMSWPEWIGSTTRLNAVSGATSIGTAGSIICIDPSKDFGLDSDLATGVLGQFNFQANLNVTNTSTLTFPVDITMIVVYDGLLVLTNNSAVSFQNFTNKQTVLTAPISEKSYNEIQRVFGSGDFFSRIGEAFKRGYNYVKDNKLLSKALAVVPHPVAQAASQFANQVGFGEETGGRQISNSMLKNRARK